MTRRERMPLCDLEANHVGLIKPSALGDVVHALPVLHALRCRYPKARLTWIVNRAYEPLLRGHPDLDATLPFDRGAARAGWLRGASSFAGFLRAVRRQEFDLVIDLQGLLRTGLMTWASGARRRVGLASAREGASWFYTDTLPTLEVEKHAVDRYWLVCQALGVGHLRKRFHVPLAAEAQEWANRQLAHHARPWILLHGGTRWETKRWPAQHFARLASRALRSFGGTAVLVGGKDEAAASVAIARELEGPALDLTGKTTLPQLAAVLARADVLVSNDSGPLHLAAALARPVVAPYTCTSPARTGPYPCLQAAVATRVWCAASYRKTCSRMDCMAELTPDRLWPALERALAPWQQHIA